MGRTLRTRKKCQPSGKEVALAWLGKETDPPWLEIKKVSEEIGLGLFAGKDFIAGEFIVEYAGELITEAEGNKKEDQTYIFYFKHGQKKWCIDASSSERKGKFINDEWRKPNACVQQLDYSMGPRLAIFAKREIRSGDEVRYNYGQTDAEWRKNHTNSMCPQGQPDLCHTFETDIRDLVLDKEQHSDTDGSRDIPDMKIAANRDQFQPADTNSTCCEGQPDLAHAFETDIRYLGLDKEQHLDTDGSREIPDVKIAANRDQFQPAGTNSMCPQGQPDLCLSFETDIRDLVLDKEQHSDTDGSREIPDMKIAANRDQFQPADTNSMCPEGQPDLCHTFETDIRDLVLDKEQHLDTDGSREIPDVKIAANRDQFQPADTNSTCFEGQPDLAFAFETDIRDLGLDKEQHLDTDGSREIPEEEMVTDEDQPRPASTHSMCPEGQPDLCHTFETDIRDLVLDKEQHLDTDGSRVIPDVKIAANRDQFQPADTNSTCFEGQPDLAFAFETDIRDLGLDKEQHLDTDGSREIPEEEMVTDEDQPRPASTHSMCNEGHPDLYHDSLYQRKCGADIREYVPDEKEDLDMTDSEDETSETSESNVSEYEPDEEEYSDTEDTPEINDSETFATEVDKQDCGNSYDPVDIASSSSVKNDDEAKMSIRSGANLSISLQATSSDAGIIVQVTSNDDGHRLFDKKFPCFYCSKPQAQIQRHLREQHSQESEVQQILNETDKHGKYKHMTLLRNRGTHRHNCQVIREGKGMLIVAYRPTVDASPADYGPCDCCLGYYVRTDLWKHECKLRSKKTRRNTKPALSCKLLLPNPHGVSAGLHSVTQVMSNDQISLVAKGDPLIVDLGERHFLAQGHDADMHATIRSKMREAARLLVELRSLKEKPNASMEEFIDPRHFRCVVAAVQKVTGYDEIKQGYKVPSLALKYGHSLKKMAVILTGTSSEIGDNDKYTRSKQFIERLDADWSVFVSSNALRTISQRKMNNRKLIPLTEDVAALTNMLKEEGRRCVHILLQYSEEPTDEKVEAWRELNELTLTLLMLFNRRRQGEISKMKIKEVDKIDTMQKDSNVVKALSNLEQRLCKVLSRVEIVGKKGRLVPVLMTYEMREWITLLLEGRQDLGAVHEENEFVFARSFYGSKGHLRACDSLRKYSQLCGAKYPETLTGTQLRKQLATLSQLLCLKENEMDMVANFLGHDLKIHREYYRLPMEIMQVAKVSKLLLAMEKGGSALAQGQSLDDIPIVDEEIDQSNISTEEEEGEGTEDQLTAIKRSKADKPHPARKQCKKKKTVTKRPWTEEQKAAVNRHLHHFMVLNQLPGKSKIDECISKEPVLSTRSWKNIKDYCRNTMKNQVR
ncbi:uncharacterized protein [Apostichopus japonicus]|uniref:uncharacterized protein n=1 Tax=Stichopus japonicus TaxID=307972 RepID=UPI003AB325FA